MMKANLFGVTVGGVLAVVLLAQMAETDRIRAWTGVVVVTFCIALAWALYYLAETTTIERHRERDRMRGAARQEASERPQILDSLRTPTGRIIRKRVLERRGLTPKEADEQIQDELFLASVRHRR